MTNHSWQVEICDRGSGKALFNQCYDSFQEISDRLSHLSRELPAGYFIRVSPPTDINADQLAKLSSLVAFEIGKNAEVDK